MDVDGLAWVLEVVSCYSGLDGVKVTAGLHIDVAGDSWITIGESSKDGIVGIGVDEDYATGGLAYQLLHELEGIEGLSIEIDT